MAKKLLKTLVNNLGFKILAVALAFILWLVVYNIDDPKKTKTYTTNVTVENAAVVTDMNKCYEVLNGTNTVTFSVTGKRSELDKLDDTDFTAVADMNRLIVSADGDKASVPIEINTKRSFGALSINSKNKYLELSLEDLMSRRYMISADTSGKVAEGYALGEVTVTNPNVLNVSGPASLVKKVDKVVATIDVDGMSSNLTDNVIPILYDADGKEVDTTRLTLSNTTVTISAKILSVKEVPLVFSTSGKPYGEYRVVEISSAPDTVKLKGTSSILNPLVSLEIPSSVINVSGAKEDVKTTIDITEYLPEGVELVNSSDASVTVTVRIEAYASRTYQLSSAGIRVEGLDDNYDLTFDSPDISVVVSALQEDLEKLKQTDMHATIDVSGLSEGTHQVELILKLDEEHYAYQPINVSVTISSKKTDDTGSSEDNVQDSSENENQ
ncbi:MAG: CdaR family protein [Lachnospiraceae bacterium]|nr:CdaR family protein [Agathobacter sp.]MDD6446201.1 CdaR family protein [Lachnospiraceae bacterium]MDY4892912.1 CdaR family protein [Agathobacter sp.]